MNILELLEEAPINADLGLKISEGKFPGVSIDRMLGYSGAGNISTSFRELWGQGGIFYWPASAQDVEIVSNNENDLAASTGAHKIIVEGLSSTYALVSEEVTLNGTTAVDLETSFLRINKMYVSVHGTSNANLGNITLRIDGEGATLLYMAAGDNQSFNATRTIPLGYTGVLINWFWNFHHTSAMTGRCIIEKKIFGGYWSPVDMLACSHFTVMQKTRDFAPIIFPAKSDMRVKALASTSGSSMFVGDLILLPD